MPSLTFERQEPTFQPYFIGCQGPSKGKCNSTIAKAPSGMHDLDHNWCGVGCGSELCIQPGTSNASLVTYLGKFGKGMDWLNMYTVNDYTICPECYRQKQQTAKREHIQRTFRQSCRICKQGVCAKCEKCRQDKLGQCSGCWSGGCLPSCQSCWDDILV